LLTEITSDLPAVTGNGAELVLEKAAVKELADSLLGPVLLPGNAAYVAGARSLAVKSCFRSVVRSTF